MTTRSGSSSIGTFSTCSSQIDTSSSSSRKPARVASPSGGKSEYLMGRKNGLVASVKAGRIIFTRIWRRPPDACAMVNVGNHLPFFEMLGNFSFGDYFKEKAIPYAYELLTKELGLEPARLWAGIHDEDDESDEIWKKTGIPPRRIRRFGDEYNFWAAGPTGPCGPDSEVHYDWGEEHGCRLPDCGPNCEHPGCDRFLEIWNLVFIQWDRDQAGRRTPLARKGIDTGMGLERITAVVNRQRRGVFETDLFRPLIEHWEKETGKQYGTQAEVDTSLRVMADHARGTTMLMADGVIPSNEGRGYVLRRLIRRAMVHARRLGPNAHLSSGVPMVARLLGDIYPEARKQANP